MRIFLLVYFWLTVFGLFLKLVEMTVADYPRKQTYSLGQDAVTAILTLAFLFWCAIILWL